MPYLRLYSPDLSIDQKRVLAQKLIEITMRTFHLRADERCRTSIQFITLPHVCGVGGLQTETPRSADVMLEVMGHDLTEEKKRAFAKEAAVVLTHLVTVKPWSRIARLLGIEAGAPQLQFSELSPAISDPFLLDPNASSVFLAPGFQPGIQLGQKVARGSRKFAA
jgi:hypothetical protein